MAKYKTDKTEKSLSTSEISRYVHEATNWKDELRQYWDQIDKNQELYEFYKHEYEETDNDVSLNTPYAIVESIIAKANEASINITVRAKGENNLGEIESWIAAVLKQAIEDPDVAAYYGSFRKIKEQYLRELLVKGNAVAAVDWCYKTAIIDGNKKPMADNPYTRLIPLKSVIFNPTRTIADSNVYYVESYTTYKELKANEYDKETDKGKYKNLSELKEKARKENKWLDDQDQQFITDDRKINRKIEPVKILERWEGAKYCVIANDKTVIREEFDPQKTGRHNLLISMLYPVLGRPYAYGKLDSIYKPVRAQDTLVNQKLDMLNRYLRPGFIIDPNASIDLDQFIVLIENGGVMQGNIQGFSPITEKLPMPPAQAFSEVNELQQAIERAALYSPYAAGVPSQETDKTSGTLGGIARLQAASEPNFQVILDTLQDSFMQPLARLYLTMIGNLIAEGDVRYGLLQDRTPEWIKVSKGILQGKTTIAELVKAGIISPDTAIKYTYALQPVTDDYGNPAQKLLPIPGADQAVVFDVDWILEVKLDNQSAADKQEEVQRQIAIIETGRKLGVMFDGKQTIIKMGRQAGFYDIEELIIDQPAPMPSAIPPQAGQMPTAMPEMAQEASIS